MEGADDLVPVRHANSAANRMSKEYPARANRSRARHVHDTAISLRKAVIGAVREAARDLLLTSSSESSEYRTREGYT